MNYSNAMKEAMRGKMIRRKSWGENEYIGFVIIESLRTLDGNLFKPYCNSRYSFTMVHLNENNVEAGWITPHPEMLADDWEVI